MSHHIIQALTSVIFSWRIYSWIIEKIFDWFQTSILWGRNNVWKLMTWSSPVTFCIFISILGQTFNNGSQTSNMTKTIGWFQSFTLSVNQSITHTYVTWVTSFKLLPKLSSAEGSILESLRRTFTTSTWPFLEASLIAVLDVTSYHSSSYHSYLELKGLLLNHWEELSLHQCVHS